MAALWRILGVNNNDSVVIGVRLNCVMARLRRNVISRSMWHGVARYNGQQRGVAAAVIKLEMRQHPVIISM